MKNKYKTKTKVNYSINSEIVNSFNDLADKKSVNKSKLIGQLIQKWINENL
jgi:hypothetical protein